MQKARNYLTIEPGMKKQLQQYLNQTGWSLHVKKLAYLHPWEEVIVEGVYSALSPYIATLVASAIALSVLPTPAFGGLFYS